MNGKLLSTTASRRAIGPRLEAYHQEQIDGFDHIIGARNGNGPPTPRLSQLFRMRDGQRPAVSQVNVERAKRLGAVELSKLLDRHVLTLT
ncbi:MAG: hypothetical protein ACREJM_03255 [Candidatus Saccharimonadales bacterium]